MKSLICTAIHSKSVISFYYDGFERVVEPHLLGEKTTGNIALSAYQIRGYSESGSVPFWRNYVIEKISKLKVLDEHFQSARDGYNPNDSTMLKIICRL